MRFPAGSRSSTKRASCASAIARRRSRSRTSGTRPGPSATRSTCASPSSRRSPTTWAAHHSRSSTSPSRRRTGSPRWRSGAVDLECGATTITAERQREVAFSPVIFVSGTRLVVPRSRGIRDLRALAGRPRGGGRRHRQRGRDPRVRPPRRAAIWTSSPRTPTARRSTSSTRGRPTRSPPTTSLVRGPR